MTNQAFPGGTPKDAPRATDADRDAAADLLHAAVADGRLEVTEQLDRMDDVYRARTLDELQALVADIGRLPARVESSNLPARAINPQAADQAISVFSSTRREGSWVMPTNLNTFSLCGSGKFDLTQAQFSSADTEINVGVIMGDVKIKLPDGVAVIDQTTNIMSSVDFKGLTPPIPGAPTITLKGFLIMGEIKVIGSGHRSFTKKF